MNHQFTKELGEWLTTPEKERDYKRGAEMLFQLNHNVIMYRNISANPQRKADYITYNLRKYYNVRVADFTHEEVVELKKQAEAISQRYSLKEENPDKGFKGGKRGDHDQLPEKIQTLYVENLDILHKMREVQTRLRILSETKDGTVCPDSDLYPFLKELIALDKKYHENWHAYDTYDPVAGVSTMAVDAREQSKRNLRLVNLNKGKYAKNPNETLAAQIRDWYAGIIAPTPKLTKELTDLGIL